MSFNVLDKLNGFQTIVPCGLEGDQITCLEKLIGFNNNMMHDVGNRILYHFANVCDRPLTHYFVDDNIPEFIKKLKPPLN